MWMFNCKDISEKISLSMDQTLPLYQRLMIRMHVGMCHCCKAVEKQIEWLRKVSREPEQGNFRPDEKVTLSDTAKERMKETIEYIKTTLSKHNDSR